VPPPAVGGLQFRSPRPQATDEDQARGIARDDKTDGSLAPFPVSLTKSSHSLETCPESTTATPSARGGVGSRCLSGTQPSCQERDERGESRLDVERAGYRICMREDEPTD
jgi:hypothetical protein